MATTTAAVFDDLAKNVKAELVQRDAEVDAILLALIARVHILFLGEPGIAKTLVVERLLARIEGLRHFYRAFGPFTAPEHVFGNLSIKGLKEDRQMYVTTGKLPEAHVATFDEWTRAGNAVLQEMLQAWNERTFEQDGQVVKMPLMCGIFLCNFLIDDKDMQEMAAAYDRILVRRTSEPVTDAAGLRALDTVTLDPSPAALLTLDDLIAAQAAAALVVIPDDVTDARIEIFGKLTRAGMRPSSRRYRESLAVVRAAAFLAGRTEAIPEDCDALVDVFWHTPDQRREVERIVWETCSPGMTEVSKLIDDLAKVTNEVDAAMALKTDDSGVDVETACVAARRSVTLYAKKVKLLEGQGRRSDAALADVWRRLQLLHDRITRDVMEIGLIPLEDVLSNSSLSG